ncbi:CubicO group peptidase (beta-lactamase class C family) [Devosia sp. UYZn731]|uniref:serine hydrolase domain-containing protein n=1 Tax=Devosia sp. UYZn731 TaxID=3156345 RepID=UPI003392B494
MVDELARLVDQSALASEVPLAIAVCNGAGKVDEVSRGRWPDGRLVRITDRFYAASLAKQVTGAAAAVLVREGRLDPDLPVAHYLPDMPEWAGDITARHLAHHTAGLPAAGQVEPAEGDWTDALVLAALQRLPELVSAPGTAYLYSNLGYVILAHVIARAAGCAFPRFATTRLFEPLGLDDIGFVEHAISNFPQASLMGPSQPLTMGDGGVWATAGAFSKWLHHQNRDTLGIADLVTAPGKLISGDLVDYGWGLGLRRRNGQSLFIHGGEWTGSAAKAVRSPSTGIAIAAMSSGASMGELTALIEAVLEEWIGG